MKRGVILRRGLTALLTVVILFTSILSGKQVSAATNNITIKNYVIRLVNALELDTTNKTYYEVAVENGLLKESEKVKLDKSLSNQFAAVLTDRAEQIMLGDKYKYDKDLYDEIISKNRISDIKKASKSCHTSIYMMFSKGIMIGFSNGKYKHTRSFKPRTNITLSEAKTIINRLTTKSKRKKLSPDGQVIRTTNLPKNYKSYEYILEAFPNAFYEKKFNYQITKYYSKPIELKDYASPAKIKKKKFNGYNMQEVLDANLDKWCKKIETNLKTRLNADYRTIGTKWINTLRNTYFIYDNADMDKDQTNSIKHYVTKMKKNKVVIKGTVSVEPSTLYYTDGYYIRAYIKFKVLSAKSLEIEENIIFGNNVYIPNFKKNKWYVRYVDIGVASNNGRSTGEDYAIFSLLDTIY